MRIHGANQNEISRIGKKDNESTAGAKGAKSSGDIKADVVTLGGSAQKISARSSVEGSSTLDPAIAARLEEVRGQIKNNQYAVDYSKLAENILGDEVARAGDAE